MHSHDSSHVLPSHRPRPGHGDAVANTVAAGAAPESSSSHHAPSGGTDSEAEFDFWTGYGPNPTLPQFCSPDHQPHAIDYLYTDLDGYLSDDVDMSDDGGAPLASSLSPTLLSFAPALALDHVHPDGHGSTEDPPDDEDPVPMVYNIPGALINAISVMDIMAPSSDPQEQPLPPPPTPPLAMLIANSLDTFHDALVLASQQPSLLPPDTQSLLQQLEQEHVHILHNSALDNEQGDYFYSPNSSMLNPGNLGLEQFLYQWGWQVRGPQSPARERSRSPLLNQIGPEFARRTSQVRHGDLCGDKCDLQGINWEKIGVTRREARERRLLTFQNYVNRKGSDSWHPRLPDVMLPRSASFFRFRRMHLTRSVCLTHFQLRNTLACTSRTHAYYAGDGVVYALNPTTGDARVAMKFADFDPVQLSTLAAAHGVLATGGFSGEYAVKSLETEAGGDTHEGILTTHTSGITNHVQICLSRSSSSPQAAFASNDMGFRMLDVATDTIVCNTTYPFPINCSAISPDRRLRVMVGDDCDVLIVAAENERNTGGKPDVLQQLSGHRDFGFACDWADDGYTVATGYQDKTVKIWDARRWTTSDGKPNPICTLRSEMAAVRSLKFSPVGSGKRVLAAVEEADFINIIDAQTYRTKQTVDVFGELGGVAFANEGRDLYVLACDRSRGGLIQLERCGLSGETVHDESEVVTSRDAPWRRRADFDWPSNPPLTRKQKESQTRRRLHAAALEGLDPF